MDNFGRYDIELLKRKVESLSNQEDDDTDEFTFDFKKHLSWERNIRYSKETLSIIFIQKEGHKLSVTGTG